MDKQKFDDYSQMNKMSEGNSVELNRSTESYSARDKSRDPKITFAMKNLKINGSFLKTTFDSRGSPSMIADPKEN